MAGPPQPKTYREPKAPKRLNPMSARRRRELPLREKCRRAVEKRDGWRCWADHIGWPTECRSVGARQDLELHETTPRGRDSKAWLNPAQCRLLCPGHHDEVTNATGAVLALARDLGLDVKAGPLTKTTTTTGGTTK